ncbi:hypothetical protein KAR91_23650 [Candidatus Pacearchaeota archaeon]|nr:hypothetical protein [Candidatus Pacearchaeota archaeon]
MTKITVDFETRSKVDISKAGAWRYAMDPSTEVFCCVFKKGEDPPVLWVNPYFRKIVEAFYQNDLTLILHDYDLTPRPLTLGHDDVYEAFNAEFEQAIWEMQMHKFGWKRQPIERWRCSAAKGAAHALPRKLDSAIMVLDLPEKKDSEGHSVMMRLSKPKKPSKKSPGIWDEDPEKLLRLFKYCIQDGIAEHEFSKELADLNPVEQKVWFIDQKINRRGLFIDVPAVTAVLDMIHQEQARYAKEMQKICLCNPTQVAEVQKWIQDRGVQIPNMRKETLEEFLEQDLRPEMRKKVKDKVVRRVMEIRLQAGKSSTSKYDAMMAMVWPSGRIRGTTMYHAASTGRWGGKGVQVHNMIRKTFPPDVADEIISMIQNEGYDLLDDLYEKPMTVASRLTRSMIKAAPGLTLRQADYNAIEARFLAWLAGEQHILDAFVEGRDVYKIAAMFIYGRTYDEITKDSEERQTGKTADLAGGYGGGWAALKGMAVKFGIKPPAGFEPVELKDWYAFPQFDKQGKLIERGPKLSYVDACYKKWGAPIIKSWREGRPATVRLWGQYELAAITAVKRPGEVFRAGHIPIDFGVAKGFLFVRLPSGRKLAYYKPEIRVKRTPWGKPAEVVTFLGVDSKTKQWVRQSTYGGRWAENITQAGSRDIIAPALVRLEQNSYPVVLHVHDEAVAEMNPAVGSLDELIQIMEVLPSWAEGLPIKAEGWEGIRYRK